MICIKEYIIVAMILFCSIYPHTYKNPNVDSNHLHLQHSILLGCTININSASLEMLQEIPYIGPSKAMKIQQQRPYSKPSDITRVKGIGPKTYKKIEPYIRIKDEPCNVTF